MGNWFGAWMVWMKKISWSKNIMVGQERSTIGLRQNQGSARR